MRRAWGERLRVWRQEVQRWSRAELRDEVEAAAYKLGESRGQKLDQRLISRWETGAVLRPQSVYCRLLAHLGAPLPSPSESPGSANPIGRTYDIKIAAELTASIAGNDPDPLTAFQTTHGTDLAIAALADRGTVARLKRWLDDSDNAVLRVNSAGILAKISGLAEASQVTAALTRDPEIRHRYMTAVVARVCGLDWPVAEQLANNPAGFPQPVLAAQRFAREALSDRDAGARWCAAAMLQALSPMIGK